MEKLKKATKKITAVAATAAVLTSSVFGAGLANYPTNFVEDSKFNGKVVIGSDADAAAATSLIADLEKEFSGDENKVKISYKKTSSADGESIDAVRDNNELNYGEDIGTVTESAGFDDSDSDMLEDGRFNNGVSDEDYEQTLKLENGKFNYALRDNVDGVNEIKEGIYYADSDTFATYSLDLKSEITLSGSSGWDSDFIGETLTIMGNDFTIGAISESSNSLSKLELLGGANKVSLGEGETTTVTVEGNEYEIAVDSVSSDKVLLSVNGQSESITEYDSEEVAGINLAVTDLVESSRDAVKGYAEIVVGGQKITLEDGGKKVQINDEDIDDVHTDYEVTSEFTGTGFDKITLTYKVSDDMLLEKGDSLKDVLFQAFVLEFEGTNEPEYTTVEVKVNDDDLEIKGKTEKGEDLTLALHVTGDDLSIDTAQGAYVKGDQDSDRVFVKGFEVGTDGYIQSGAAAAKTVTFSGPDDGTADEVITVDGKAYTADTDFATASVAASVAATNFGAALTADGHVVDVTGAVVTIATASVVETTDGANEFVVADSTDYVSFDLSSTGIKGSGFLIERDSEEQYLYELTSVDTTDVNHEVDFDEWLRGDNEEDIKRTEWSNKLGNSISNVLTSANYTALKFTELSDMVAFEGEAILNLATAEDNNKGNALSSTFVIGLDTADVDADSSEEEKDGIRFTLGWDKTDKEFDIAGLEYVQWSGTPDAGAVGQTTSANAGGSASSNGDFTNEGLADNKDGDSDVQTFITKYGIKVEYDNDEKRSAKVMIPEKQVEAKVNVVFGEAGSTKTGSTTVAADEVEAKKAELEADGYTITGQEDVEATEAEFDVTGAVMDSEVTGTEDMIVVGGPAVNAVARELLDITEYTVDQAGVAMGEGMIKYFDDKNTVLVYGYSAEDTKAAVEKLNAGGLSGTEVKSN